MENSKTAIIIGAGPAGLTAAYELLKTTDIKPIILEETGVIGGISQTVKHNGYRMDIGGHRFFSKSDQVMQWWENLMPIQGSPSYDDIELKRERPLNTGGPNPEKEDRVMLYRNRVSRILYLRKFFDYPISMKPETFVNMGFGRTMKAGFGYIGARLHKRTEVTLEDFMINRFGSPLYEMFFEKYTEKVWGKHPSKISADWGAQRIKGLSLTKALLSAIKKPFTDKKGDISQKNQETSLIEQFIYPKFGPGQLWETAAKDIEEMGGAILLNSKVIGVNVLDENILSVTIQTTDGETSEIKGDYFISSMPIKDLVNAVSGEKVPDDVFEIADNLPYRDFITVGLLVNKLKLKNTTDIKTVFDIVPDTWIYIQEDDVKIGRLQIFNNWSPYLIEDKSKVWIGLEYFCNEGDELWEKSDDDFIQFAIDELSKINVIDKEDVLDSVRVRVKKAYPAYFGTYEQFDKVKDYLDKFKNLYCVGRNGQHRYNNMDHSMMTAFETVNVIKNNNEDKQAIWQVNTEEKYSETN